MKTKAKDTLKTDFEVLKPEYGIVAVYASMDPRGQISARPPGSWGSPSSSSTSVATFKRDPKTKQPNVVFEYQLLDEKGKPTMEQPVTANQDETSLNKVDEKDGAFVMQFTLFMSRPGKFTAKITATDKVTSKSATYELPVTVQPAN